MSIKCFLIVLCIFSVSFKGFSQTKKQVDSMTRVIGKIVSGAVDAEKVKDSTAVYGLSILFEVDIKGNEQFVSITTNNSTLAPGLDFKVLDKLRKLDYRLLMENKPTAKFSFKLCFIVYDSKYNPQVVKLDDVYEVVKKLNPFGEFNIHNLGLMVIEFDKKVYN